MNDEDENEEELFDEEEEEGENDIPSQEDINEGILVDDERRMAHYRHNVYFDLGQEEADADDIYATAFWEGLAAVIAENDDESLRIFHVNDHGNVTEYDTEGRVIGEWV